MKRFLGTSLLFLFMVLVSSAWAGSHATLPKALLAAKTAYVEDVSWHSSVGVQCSDELKKWGRFKLVGDEKEADLVFHLTGTIEDLTTLEVVDARDQVTLWSSKPDKVRKIMSELRKRVEQQGKQLDK
jgi:hypothetical protein